MADFDPYHKWLGIPPKDQPPNHYRLLGIDLFESDPDVIDAAAEQRMGFLQHCSTGQHGALSQKLLNEVSRARLCLLNLKSKASYDKLLGRTETVPSATEATPPDQHTSSAIDYFSEIEQTLAHTVSEHAPKKPDFDPYLEFLGIPTEHQPPNHYRLFGLPLFESDPDAIDAAATRRVEKLRLALGGRHTSEAQRLMDEVAWARLCLLSGRRRAAYDAELRKFLDPDEMFDECMSVGLKAARLSPVHRADHTHVDSLSIGTKALDRSQGGRNGGHGKEHQDREGDRFVHATAHAPVHASRVVDPPLPSHQFDAISRRSRHLHAACVWAGILAGALILLLMVSHEGLPPNPRFQRHHRRYRRLRRKKPL